MELHSFQTTVLQIRETKISHFQTKVFSGWIFGGLSEVELKIHS